MGKSQLQGAQAFHQQVRRKQRVNCKRQLGLATAGYGFRVSSQGFCPLNHLTRIVEDHPTRFGQNRSFCGSIKQGQTEVFLQRLHRLAHARLHTT
jgi:hypothetical protein